MTSDDRREWLEPDGLGGFASGTAAGIRTRRYHALLLAAATPPTGRMVLVNRVDAWIDTRAGSFALSTQRYEPGLLHPDGVTRMTSFTTDPWPTWGFTLPDGTVVEHSVVVPHGQAAVRLSWRVVQPVDGVRLRVRAF